MFPNLRSGSGISIETMEARVLLSSAPVIVHTQFNFDTGHSIAITFDKNVGKSIDGADISLVNQTTNQVILGDEIEASFDEKSLTATFTFPKQPDGLLAEGNWLVMVSSAGIFGPDGVPMEADFTFKVRFLRGDANNDGIVNLLDFNTLASNFGQPGTFSQGDFNYDGEIDLNDFNLLAGRFGMAI